MPPESVVKMLKTLKACKITKKELKDSKLHLTLTNIIKTNTTNKEHKAVIDLVD